MMKPNTLLGTCDECGKEYVKTYRQQNDEYLCRECSLVRSIEEEYDEYEGYFLPE